MNLSVGIVGLPNVGKSTLFNALLKKQQALAANFPFATIEPNVGIVPVPDSRLESLAEIVASESSSFSSHPNPLPQGERESLGKLPPIKNALIEFVDIAGLVKGASEGAGLGNKFLSHIREVKIIAHVVRGFTDDNVIREGSSDPESDYGVVQTELILADLASAQNHESRVKSPGEKALFQRITSDLNSGVPVRDMNFSEEEQALVDPMFFLTAKPEIIVINVNEDDYTAEKIPEVIIGYKKLLGIASQTSPRPSPERRGSTDMVVICAKIESELATLSDEEQKEYLKDLGIEKSGLERLIQKAYEELGLISFLTAGEKEVKAWTIDKGIDAQNAAGAIHTDFIKKFIKAEVVSFDDYISIGGRKKARELGKARLEGKDYIVQDGDVIEFKIGS